MRYYYMAVLICISMVFSFRSSAQDIVLPQSELERFYFQTLGDLDNNNKMPFPTLMVYDKQTSTIIAKADMTTIFGHNLPLNFVRHTDAIKGVKALPVASIQNNIASNVRYVGVFIVALDWVIEYPEFKQSAELVDKVLSAREDTQVLKLFQ